MAFPFIILLFFVIGVIVKQNYFVSNTTTKTEGIVTKEFFRGKLFFCEFTYTVNNSVYRKKQEAPKHLKNKLLHQKFVVLYNVDNPKQAEIKYK